MNVLVFPDIVSCIVSFIEDKSIFYTFICTLKAAAIRDGEGVCWYTIHEENENHQSFGNFHFVSKMICSKPVQFPELLNTPCKLSQCSARRKLENPFGYLYFSNKKGWGLFANQFVDKHVYLAPYLGEYITTVEADRRYRESYDKQVICSTCIVGW